MTSPETSVDKKNRLFFWSMLLKELRVAREVSQRSLSRASGVSRNTIRKIEACQTDPSIYAVERILQALGHELEAMDVKPETPLDNLDPKDTVS